MRQPSPPRPPLDTRAIALAIVCGLALAALAQCVLPRAPGRGAIYAKAMEAGVERSQREHTANARPLPADAPE